MTLLGIAVENLRRRKIKALILAIGVIVAIATSVTLFTVTTSMRENIDAQLDQFGTNILITPRYHETPLTYAGITVFNVTGEPIRELSMDDVKKMRTIEARDNLNIISPKTVGSFEYQGSTALLVGIEFDQELRIKTWWTYQGKKPTGKEDAVASTELVEKRAVSGTNFNNNEVIAGANLAGKYHIGPGSRITIAGKSYEVASVLGETGSSDDNVLFMDLTEAQEILNKKGRISLIEANAFCLDCPLPTIASQLREKLPYADVSALREAMAQKQASLSMFSTFSVVSASATLVAAIVIVMATMMASVKERTREIGIFRAVGFRKRHIITIIVSEAGIIGLVGGLLGYIIGFSTSKIIVPILAPQAKGFYFNPNTINLTVISIAVGAALFMSSVAALYPAIKAAKQDPAEALRFI